MIGRLKFEIDPLVKKMLDKLPEDVIVNGTILDPAMGGGQFVKEVERRKRAAGKTDAEISATVFGVEENVLRKNYAVNKNKLVGTYTVDNFLTKDFNMKFDVVLGNPPYQDSRAPTLKLWHKFVERGFDLVNQEGYLAFVTPRSWVERPNSQLSNKIVTEIFAKNQLAWLDITAKNSFPGVGENPCAYCVIKTPKTQLTEVELDNKIEMVDYCGQKIPLDELDHYKVSIFPKLVDQGLGTLLNVVYSDSGTATSVEVMIQNGILYDTPQPTATHVKVFWTAANTNSYYMERSKIKPGIKVIINRSGYYYHTGAPDKYILIDDANEYAIGAGAFGITCNTITEANNLISLLTTKLYRWYIDNEKTSGFNTGITKLPLLDLSRSWTDADVFKLFNITQDEEQYINDFYS